MFVRFKNWLNEKRAERDAAAALFAHAADVVRAHEHDRADGHSHDHMHFDGISHDHGHDDGDHDHAHHEAPVRPD